MKKRYFIIILLSIFMFIPVVFADDTDSINVGIVGNLHNSQSGNLAPSVTEQWRGGKYFNNMSVYGTNVTNTFKEGSRYQVVAKYCVDSDGTNNWVLNYKNSARITINSYDVRYESSPCPATYSNGDVQIWPGYLYITVDFTFNYFGSSTTWQSNFQLGDTTSDHSLAAYFVKYDIYNSEEINNNNNTDKIINNQSNNTQEIIDNNNANTDRIIDNQNANTQSQINNDNANSQAEIDATNRNTQAVNDVNDSINDTDTTGSENALSSIINDSSFQDNTGINSIITLPLAMISSLSNTCQPININIPFINTNTSLPCFRSIINQHMPLLANMISIVINGFILYRVFVDIVGIIKSARNPDDDRLDVLEL